MCKRLKSENVTTILLLQEQFWGDWERAILSKTLQIKKQNNKTKDPKKQTQKVSLFNLYSVEKPSDQLYPQVKVILNQTLSCPKEQTLASTPVCRHCM